MLFQCRYYFFFALSFFVDVKFHLRLGQIRTKVSFLKFFSLIQSLASISTFKIISYKKYTYIFINLLLYCFFENLLFLNLISSFDFIRLLILLNLSSMLIKVLTMQLNFKLLLLLVPFISITDHLSLIRMSVLKNSEIFLWTHIWAIVEVFH